MPPVGFEPTISAGERPQIYALDRAATGTGTTATLPNNFRGVPQVNSGRLPHIRPRSLFSHPFQITLHYHQTTERYLL